ncbi:hypothetical protein E1218_29060 [Kribbella turkmenica]|uniref:Uncharacterized protein n=1 Tax=Kribbella turkmenica TaxID=2530375 RepID=A0A4R4WES9_9ACTN|nr:hypothetical protein E1218_29060 [Kribbella turkmenica]
MTAASPPAVRRLVLATLVNTPGNGLYFAVGALYLTRAAGTLVDRRAPGAELRRRRPPAPHRPRLSHRRHSRPGSRPPPPDVDGGIRRPAAGAGRVGFGRR